MTDGLHNSVELILAAAIVARGGTASALTMSRGALLAALHNNLSDGADLSHLTSSENQILAAIHNFMSDGADLSQLTSGQSSILAAVASLDTPISALRVSGAPLWQAFADSVVSFTPAGGGGGDVPTPPDGFDLLKGGDGAYLLGGDSAYLYGETP